MYINPVENDENLPQTSLKGFQRISLKQGETKIVNFTIAIEQLKIVNIEGEKAWRKGTYKVIVGNSSSSELSVKLGGSIPQIMEFKLR